MGVAVGRSAQTGDTVDQNTDIDAEVPTLRDPRFQVPTLDESDIDPPTLRNPPTSTDK